MSGIYNGMVNTFHFSTPPQGWGTNYQSPTPPSYDEQMRLHYEQRHALQERQQRASEQTQASAVSQVFL